MISWPNTSIQALAEAHGKRGILQCYLEDIPDVLCTQAPPDPKTMTYSLDFDGTDDYLETSAAVANLTTTGDMTFCAWVKPTDLAARRYVFSWYNSIAPFAGWALAIETTGQLTLEASGGNVASGSGNVVTAGVWNFIAFAHGGEYDEEAWFAITTVAADGTITTKRATTSGISGEDRTARAAWAVNTRVVLGSATGAPASTFLGRIGCAAVFDRALTFSELGRIKYRILDQKWAGFWSNLRAQWTLEEGSGSTTVNSASTGGTYSLTQSTAGYRPTWQTDPPYTLMYRALMGVVSSFGQDLEPRATTTSVSGVSFRVLDTSDWLTSVLAARGLAVKGKAASVFLGFEGLLDDEYMGVISGAVESIDPLAGRGYEVRIGDAKRFAKIGFALCKTTLDGALTDVATTVTVDSCLSLSAITQSEYNSAGSVPNWRKRGYLKVDDEIIQFDHTNRGASGSPPAWTSCTRGVLGTTAAAHSDGATVQEVFAMRAVNPIDAALYLLMSGQGNQAVDTTYDILTRFAGTLFQDGTIPRGAGMSPSDVDVTGIVALRDARYSTYDATVVITESVDDLKDWIEQNILRQLGAFFFVAASGKLSIGSWHAPSSSGTILAAGMSRPVVSIDYGSIVNAIEFRFDVDPVDGSFANAIAYEDVDSQASHGRAGAMKLDSRWIRTDDFGASTFNPTPATLTDAVKTIYFTRFADPRAHIRFGARLADILYDVGDGVTLQHPSVPDLSAGARGLFGVLHQVVGREFDAKRGRVVLKCQRVS